MTTLGKKLPHSEETKRKISLGRKGINKGKPLGEEQRKKVVAHIIKKNKSIESRRNLSEKFSGKGNPSYGISPSSETRKKQSESMKKTLSDKDQCGEKNPNWKGGRLKLDKEYRNLCQRIWTNNRNAKKRAGGKFTKQEWEIIKKRYKYTCPLCGAKEPEISLTIDHIIPIAKGGENVILNIQPLCMKCNNKKRTKIFRITEGGSFRLF